MLNEWCNNWVYGDIMTVEDFIMEVLFSDEDHEHETKKIVDNVISTHGKFSRAEVVMGLFQLEYEGRIYQVYRDEWRINPSWC